jgi:hypothetical protein
MSNATQKAGKQGGTFAERLRGLENATQSVLQLSRELKDAEGYQSEIRRLKDEILGKDALVTKKDAEIAERDAEVAKKALLNKGLVEQFESRAAQWARERATLRQTLADEKTNQASVNTSRLEAAVKEAAAAKQRAHNDREELREVKAQLTGFKTQFKDTEGELQTLRSSIGLIDSTETLWVAS